MNPCDVLLIDAGTGNLHSVYNALKSLGVTIHLSSNPQDVALAGRIILPGVGAFSSFIDGLHQRELVEPLQQAVQRGDPLLGICVGMQALFDLSEEMGEHAGLGLLPGRVIRFKNSTERKIPQTGWNQLHFQRSSPLLKEIPDGCYVYFNHSYYCSTGDSSCVITTTDYGLAYPSVIQRANLFGVQFHPEKSQRTGLKILENFLKT